eukprot:7428348-Ditylum_brightwellii.AAC.1
MSPDSPTREEISHKHSGKNSSFFTVKATGSQRTNNVRKPTATAQTLIIIDDSDEDAVLDPVPATITLSSRLPCDADSNTGDEDDDNEEGEEEDFSVPELGRVVEVPNNSYRLGFHATRFNGYENTSMHEERIGTNYDATNRAMGHNINYTPLQPTSYGGMYGSEVPCSNGNE